MRLLCLLLAASLLPTHAAQVPVPTPTGGIPAGATVAQHEGPAVTVQTTAPARAGWLNGLRVTAGGTTRTFPAWRTISNPTFWPGVTVTDLSGDGHPEVLVTLMTDEGTGVAVYDARVLGRPDLREWPVTPPVPYLRQQVRLSTHSLTLPGRSVKLPPLPGLRGEAARIGDQVRWTVQEGRLTALVEVQRAWAFTGRLVLTYRAQGERLIPDRVRFDPTPLDDLLE
ncbi:hypothetical protein GCM10008956_38230 [Deinococcus arenae]|uniref:FG-GAP repeat protein n=1 Tax=Deinococcus arenae TaxID=1452751 RepID=A0A8H9GUE9_9DEIO|nr:hypothetical protein [Deinococcus arenae]AWT36703.1 hypothetical protein DM785_14935 [Deinococcus actinosclerus]GGM59041.1 hypothetical protein GCM10008956_38230 [Deinococcus arenae]